MENEAHMDLFFKEKLKQNKTKIKTFAPNCEWKNQTGNRRLRVRVDDVIY